MYTIIICAVIGLGIGLLKRDDQFMLSIIGALFGVMIASFSGMAVTHDTTSYMESYEIVSVNDNSGVSGWYMAMTPTMSFAMYIKTSEGYRLITQNNNATIKFDSVRPRIEYTYTKPIDSNVDNFIVPLNKHTRLVNVVIYVPENSIKKDFLLDAK
ncbi:hypothetical protein [Veillonella sp.]|uniref:hypothetical protein n=1 Tax=Veillonella sp. TaxID=1926307 RepID=UPI001B5EC583|nr:hypothetical protein [Veillonella sp.]MBP8617522.1 hypothetical protein [Veillonella sp.]